MLVAGARFCHYLTPPKILYHLFLKKIRVKKSLESNKVTKKKSDFLTFAFFGPLKKTPYPQPYKKYRKG
jgi:hypothetical protein